MPVPKVCYTAIFKNEEKNVYRCLDALKNLVDCISICDTGSQDNTIMLIQQWGKENNIPTRVHSGESQTFRDFGYNRTLSYKKAIETFPSADYLLLADADMVMKIEKSWDKSKLTADSYLFEQVTSNIRYWNVRILSTACKWECVGVTHEYWDCKKPQHVAVKTKDIWINDIGDGGNKQNKFQRDILLLTKGIEDPETNEHLKGRYKFYLANSYKDSGDPTTAIKIYQDRIDHGGWIEEIFYSYLNTGRCYMALKDHAKATEAFMLAFDKHPVRAEPLYELSKMYREKGKNQVAMLFAEKGLKVPYPTNDSLFIEYGIYEYLFLEEISISGFYAAEGKQKGKACVLKLLSMKDKIPENKYNLALSNAKHYGIDIEKLEKLGIKN